MIEMIAGVYGLRVKIGKQADGADKIRVKAMGPNDGPFSISPEQEARLVDAGLARYVTEPVEDPNVSDGAPIGFDEMPPDDFDTEAAGAVEEVEEAEAHPIEELSAKELRALGKEYGLSFKANASKVSMIDAIKAALADDAEDEPAEDAPKFDPSEAVL